ncbi:MAG TPA: hypothetical protein VNI54_15070 [Thermoanaerobaculia bacterium]|nr:hypothetical protein [Thermoanaerobaculia bacterium]
MKTISFSLSLLLLLAACGGGSQPGTTSVPGHGALTVQILPNPVVARQVSPGEYELPFEVVVRETGGSRVEIDRVSATATLPGGLTVDLEEWDAARIRSLGYSTTIAPNGELRYRFAPRREVPEAVFNGVTARLLVEGRDASGTPTTASTTVTVTR